MWYKLTRKLLTYPMLDGLAQVMIFAGVLASVGGGFFFVVAPWVMWSGIVLFIGGLCVLGYADNYLPSGEERESNG